MFNKLDIERVLIISVIVRLILFVLPHPVYWDGAAFMQIGKYIFSSGSYGLFESARPILWPIILGFIWKLNLDILFFGKLLVNIFSIASIYLVYVIAKKLFDKETGISASLLFSFSALFLIYTNQLYSEIPSIFFALLGIYFFANDNLFYSGLSLGLAFLTRFPQALMFISVLITAVLIRKRVIKTGLTLSTGFLIPLSAYFFFNYIIYKDIFYPLTYGFHIINISGIWIHKGDWYFYLVELVKQNFIFILSVPGIFYSLHKKNFVIAACFLLSLLFFSSLQHKEARYVLIVLPYAAILSSLLLKKICNTKNLRKLSISFIIFSIIITSVLAGYGYYAIERNFVNKEINSEFYNYKLNSSFVFSSNPIMGLGQDVKIYPMYYQEFFYYPYFDGDRISELFNEYNDSYLFYSECDMICPPDKNCIERREKLESLIEENFDLVYSRRLGCSYRIYRKVNKF